jgi:hypothetical protein
LAPEINLLPFRIGARHRRMADPAIDLAFWRWRRVFAQSYLLDQVFFPLLLTNGDIQLGLNRFPAQTITEGRHDAQKSIPGTSAQKGSGEGDLTAKNDRKLHPMVQIAQIVREPLDG